MKQDRTYRVELADDGTYTLVMVDEEGNEKRLPGYRYETSARVDGYAYTRPRRDIISATSATGRTTYRGTK